MNAIPKLGDGLVHISNLRHIARSAAHYRVACERRTEPTPPMRLGSLSHAILLGSEQTVAVWNGTRNAAGYKAFAAEHKDDMIVTRSEFDHATLIVEAVREQEKEYLRNNPDMPPWFQGDREKHILWEYQGRACSSRLDSVDDDTLDEFKTCTNTDPETLMRACAKMGYHAQLAFYNRAAATIGRHVRLRRIIAVETAPPFIVTVMPLSPRTVEFGDKLVRMWMERLLACEAVDLWPGYVQSPITWDLEADPEQVLIDGEPVEDAA